MRINLPKFLLLTYKPVLVILLIIGVVTSLNDLIATDISFRSLNAFHNLELKGKQGLELYKGDIVSGTYLSPYENLGSVSLRFYNSNRINDDSLIFRIKKAGEDHWYYTAVYKTDQFQPHKFFPFGFKPLANSRGVAYYFEIESLDGVPGNAIILDGSKRPNAISLHQFSKMPINDYRLIIPYFSSLFFQLANNQSVLQIIGNDFFRLLIVFVFYVLFFSVRIELKSPRFNIEIFKILSVPVYLAIIYLDISLKTDYSSTLLKIGSLFWLLVVFSFDSLYRVSLVISAVCFSLMAIYNTSTPLFGEKAATWGIVSLLIAVLYESINPPQNKMSFNLPQVKQIANKLEPLTKALYSVFAWPLVCKNFWWGVLSYTQHSALNRPVTYHLYNGLNLLSQGDCTDFQIIREIFIHNVYFKDFPVFQNKPVILDIGAHKGYFSLSAAQKYPNSQIYAFEPNPDNFKYLKRNLSLNKQHAVLASSYAVSTKNGTTNFYLAEESSVCHSVSKDMIPFGVEKTIKVKTKTLGSILSQNHLKKVDILKMDIEGHEYDILFSLPEKTISSIGVFMVEAHTTKRHNISDLEKFFHHHHYTTYRPYQNENVVVAYRKKSSSK